MYFFNNRQQSIKVLIMSIACTILVACATPKPKVEEPVITLPIRITERGVEITIPDQVLFEVGKAEVNQEKALPYFKQLVYLMGKSDKNILVEGHTDSQGQEAANQILSEKRSQAVFDSLVALGAPKDRMQMKGMAARVPVAPNDVASGRRLNRRTEIIFLGESQAKLIKGEPVGTFEHAAARVRRILEEATE